LTAETVSLLIVEDEDTSRESLKGLLEAVEDFNVVAEAGDGRAAVLKALELKPDVVLMDISMPLLDGIAATHEIKKQCKEISVVMLTAHQDDEGVFAAFAAGADGYCVKGAKLSQLTLAIRCVTEGATFLDPAIAGCILRCPPEKTPGPTNDGAFQGTTATLSPREVDVLRLVAAGLTNPEIGKRLHLSSETIKANIRRIMQKMLVDDRTQAAVKALRQGLI